MRNLGPHEKPSEYILATLQNMAAGSIAAAGKRFVVLFDDPGTDVCVQDYTLVAAQITKGQCQEWTVLTANNKIIPTCGKGGTQTIVNIVEEPQQQQKREASADAGLQVQKTVAKDEDKKPSPPPYASASADPSPPYASGSATSTVSASTAIGTIPPTELVQLIAPLHKKVEQIEAELRQAKGQLRKLDPTNPLAMGGAKAEETEEDSRPSKQNPSEDNNKKATVPDTDTPQESPQNLNDDLRSGNTAKRTSTDDPWAKLRECLEQHSDHPALCNPFPPSDIQNTKRQFPPGPAPKFTPAPGQTVASLSQKITELTEELKVAR